MKFCLLDRAQVQNEDSKYDGASGKIIKIYPRAYDNPIYEIHS